MWKLSFVANLCCHFEPLGEERFCSNSSRCTFSFCFFLRNENIYLPPLQFCKLNWVKPTLTFKPIRMFFLKRVGVSTAHRRKTSPPPSSSISCEQLQVKGAAFVKSGFITVHQSCSKIDCTQIHFDMSRPPSLFITCIFI